MDWKRFNESLVKCPHCGNEDKFKVKLGVEGVIKKQHFTMDSACREIAVAGLPIRNIPPDATVTCSQCKECDYLVNFQNEWKRFVQYMSDCATAFNKKYEVQDTDENTTTENTTTETTTDTSTNTSSTT